MSKGGKPGPARRLRCPACTEPIFEDEAQWVCPGCAIRSHESCVVSNASRCPVSGCGARAASTFAIIKPKLRTIGDLRFSRRPSLVLTGFLWAVGLSFLLATAMQPRMPRRRHRTEATMRAYQEALAKAPRWPWQVHQGLVVCAALVWGMGNLVQAFVLLRVRQVKELSQSGGGLVSIEGVPKFVDRSSLKTRGGEDCFYLHESRLERRFGRRGQESWSTINTTEYCVPFRVDGLLVRNQPTEIYGPREIDEDMETEGLKVRSIWMRYPKRVAVMGRLVQGAEGPVVEPDPLFGLIISSAGLRETMQQEFVKGFAGLALAAIYLSKLLN